MATNYLHRLGFYLLCVSLTSVSSDYRQAWSSLERTTLKTINETARSLETDFAFAKDSTVLSQDCKASIERFFEKLKKFDLEAVKMLDSWGKVPSGLLSGKWTDLGSYDQCMSLSSAKYCLLDVRMPLMSDSRPQGFFRGYSAANFSLSSQVFKHFVQYAHFFRYINVTVGLCMPKECSSYEGTQLAQKILTKHGSGLDAEVNLCQSNSEPRRFLVREIVAATVVINIILLNFLGVLFPKTYLLKEFNFVANLSKLVSAAKTRRPYPVLEGLKAMNMLAMLLGHIIFLGLYPFSNVFNILSVVKSPLTITGFIVPFTIDTFFMITGLETMSFFLRDPLPQFRALPYLLLRWIRFAIPIGWTISVYVLIFSDHVRRIIGGPFWNHIAAHYFNHPKDVQTCMMADWYLSIDYVYAVLFLLVLLPYLQSLVTLAIFNANLLIILGCILTALIAKSYQVQSSWLPMNFYQEEFYKYLIYLHSKPWTHLAPYFVGVLMAFVLKSPRPILTGRQTIPIWIIWIASTGTLIGYEIVINFNIYPIPEGAQLLYSAFSRILFALGVAWLIYIFHYDLTFPIFRQMLSSKILRIFARVNLSALFVNPLVVRVQTATLKSISYLSVPSFLISYGLPLLIFIYVLSFIFCAAIEFPTVNIMKQVFLKRLPKSPPSKTTNFLDNIKDANFNENAKSSV